MAVFQSGERLLWAKSTSSIKKFVGQLRVESDGTPASAIGKRDIENRLLELYVRDKVIVSVSLKTHNYL